MAREDGVDDLGDDGVFVADDAGEERGWIFAAGARESLAIRFSRSSSLTLRARRAGVNSLVRRAPRVAGREVAMSKYRCLTEEKGSGPRRIDGMEVGLECEVVEEGLHFAGGVGVVGAVGDGMPFFEASDGFVGAA